MFSPCNLFNKFIAAYGNKPSYENLNDFVIPAERRRETLYEKKREKVLNNRSTK